ncbi:MAG: integrase catalytic domain-containing protein, partial [Bacteroidetes bacterium]|nr:integrase catalytic domain-containing protein [Bacteroidota bacterium]
MKEHNLNHNPTLIKIRDIFLFSVYTGLRFVDAQMLTMDKVIKVKEDKYMIKYCSRKNRRSLTIPFLLPAVKIMEKYNDSPERKMFNRVIPSMSNQKLNSYLKVIASLVGITKTLSHHVATHTCATTVLLNNEVPMEVVSKWLGHTSIKTTQIYGKITNNYMQKIADK